ncbi:hypothetical protein NH8B_2801 [Pseudogulbenkiania sp. NH8B]|uniref:hypothetical protein n=1 Tax=Pseudogulbenkiania sp. (strain NH8B) TaxID=748280 RepID=UPI0002279C53|nr:hypothetical protein [Pseudogulbenkiania sp. NH8B]BAK77594.1 hypothetical protein NH8B_2801 [Pseudogulbenkiania sp. NH8B]
MKTKIEIQAQLDEFYALTLAEAQGSFDKYLDDLSSPFLISVSEGYLSADVRIMFIGKETNGWWGCLRKFFQTADSITELKKRYIEQFYRPTGKSRFLRMTKDLANELADGKRTAICWNNLMKMDWKRGCGFSRTSIGHSPELFELSIKMVQYEIDLLKPNVIIFGSGPSYDRAIKAILPERITKSVDPRALWHFTSGETQCYRTYHPNARDSSAERPIAHYYGEIIANIKSRHGERIA